MKLKFKENKEREARLAAKKVGMTVARSTIDLSGFDFVGYTLYYPDTDEYIPRSVNFFWEAEDIIKYCSEYPDLN